MRACLAGIGVAWMLALGGCTASEWSQFGYEQSQFEACVGASSDVPAEERPLRKVECNTADGGQQEAISYEEYQRVRKEVMEKP